uniref:Isoform 7 of Limb region 1 protein homolog n=1 Tax=Gallus gallus TaxID=9031 RepID=Q7ZUA6-7
MEADEVSIREQNFHSQVREYTICFLLFAVLYIVSYFIITRYKRKADEQEDEDAIVNRISFMESCFSFFQFMFVCVDALCLFLLGVGRICWLKKGDQSTHSGDPCNAHTSCTAYPWNRMGGFSSHRQ